MNKACCMPSSEQIFHFGVELGFHTREVSGRYGSIVSKVPISVIKNVMLQSCFSLVWLAESMIFRFQFGLEQLLEESSLWRKVRCWGGRGGVVTPHPLYLRRNSSFTTVHFWSGLGSFFFSVSVWAGVIFWKKVAGDGKLDVGGVGGVYTRVYK